MTFLCLLIAGHSMLHFGFIKQKQLTAEALLPKSDDYYLSFSSGGVDHYVLFHNYGNPAQHFRQAQVLFLGNSRVKQGFAQSVLEPYFKKHELKFYNLGFGYNETSPLPLALIKKFDLHPKWVIINADQFFKDVPSFFSKTVMESDFFGAWKFSFETSVSFYIRRFLHQFIPHVSVAHKDPHWIEYRSYINGSTLVAGYQGRSGPINNPQPPKKLSKEVLRQILSIAKDFKSEIEKRGGRLVLTSVPPSNSNVAIELGSALGVPVITSKLTSLYSYDGSHLDVESARRFSEEFSSEFEKILVAESKTR